MRGKSINLFLMDGEAGGRIKCTLANWTGIAYKIPRTELDRCKEREDLKQSGVYFLFGTSDTTGKGVVYIGQAGARKNGEGILNRLQEHKRNPEKDYWTEAIAFTTSNNSFGPTEISYLENRFCNLALQANRYEVKNGNDPTPGNITEEKGIINGNIGRHPIDRKKMAVVTNGGKPATTVFHVLERYKNCTFVQCRLLTGRTHQIRVHMAYIGHPLIGDSKYCNSKNKFNIEGQALHSLNLKIL